MTTYVLRLQDESQEQTTIEVESLDAARERAREWVREGDWNLSPTDLTIWVRVAILCEREEDVGTDDLTIEDTLTISIDPPEPECSAAEHEWQSPHEVVGGLRENPGVWGHGGGVISRSACMICGCQRTYDSWAQDLTTGEQGLDSVTYLPECYEVRAEEA